MEKHEIRKAYERAKQMRWISFIIGGFGTILIILFGLPLMSLILKIPIINNIPTPILGTVAFIPAIIFLIIYYKNWRCPVCNRVLPRDLPIKYNYVFCPSCGAELEIREKMI